MFTCNLNGNQCFSLKLVLENIPPKNLASLKVMDLARKSYQKIESVAEELFTLQGTINEETRKRQDNFKKAITEDEKTALEKEANDAIIPLLDKRKELYDLMFTIEYSDEQI